MKGEALLRQIRQGIPATAAARAGGGGGRTVATVTKWAGGIKCFYGQFNPSEPKGTHKNLLSNNAIRMSEFNISAGSKGLTKESWILRDTIIFLPQISLRTRKENRENKYFVSRHFSVALFFEIYFDNFYWITD